MASNAMQVVVEPAENLQFSLPTPTDVQGFAPVETGEEEKARSRRI